MTRAGFMQQCPRGVSLREVALAAVTDDIQVDKSSKFAVSLSVRLRLRCSGIELFIFADLLMFITCGVSCLMRPPVLKRDTRVEVRRCYHC